MPRTRRTRPELTESWADVDDDDSSTASAERSTTIYDEEDERREMADEFRARLPEKLETPRRRNLRASVGPPELIMPSSPDGGTPTPRPAKKRAQTPHFRMNDRSLTSDAGSLHRIPDRVKTPRSRLNERSMTSDAGEVRTARAKDKGSGDAAGQALRFSWRIVKPLISYVASVLWLAVNNAKPILGWAVLLYALVAAFVFASGFVSNSIQHALSPICRLPFTSHLSFCPDTAVPTVQGSAEFDKLVLAQDAFQDVLASSNTGLTLPLDMKRSEAGIRDLRHLVQYSKLESRNELVFEFGGFIDTARQASGDLSRFNSRIGRALDHILSTNRWTLSVIDSVSTNDAARGSVTGWLSDNLNIFSPFQPVSLSRDVLLDQYLRHTSAVEEQIINLITEAHALRDILDNLDGRLDVIASIAARDGIKLESNRDELFSSLWTKLGGNRSSVAKLQQQLALLNSVGAYRRQAWGHVTSTLLKLQEIQHSLEDLRERVALPETVGTARVPLEVHIQSINLGIERLEMQRDQNRRLAAESYDRVVKSADAHDRKMLGDREL